MSGDSMANFGIDDYCINNRNFLDHGPGYKECFHLLLKLKPDMLVAAHFGPIPISEEYLQKGLELLQEREALFSIRRCGVDDAVESTKSLDNLLYHHFHARLIENIAADDENLRAQCF